MENKTPYIYIEHPGDTLPVQEVLAGIDKPKPIIWAQEGQYGWLSKEQVQNMQRRQTDLTKQRARYTRVRPLDLVFHWSEVQLLDSKLVKLMRSNS